MCECPAQGTVLGGCSRRVCLECETPQNPASGQGRKADHLTQNQLHELLESEGARSLVEGAEERGFIEPAELEAFALEHELNEDEIEQLSRELEANGLEIGQFGAERVVGRIAIIVGLAAAARVERNDRTLELPQVPIPVWMIPADN